MPVCDPCAAGPSGAASRCRAARNCESGSTAHCEWVLDVNKTLAVRWNERGVRGWGNYWPYLRTLHFAAALLGRRFLVLHDHSLPTDYLMLGGRLSWSLPRGELSDYLVVQPAELKSWNVAHNESGMIGFLSTLADVQHVFLNVTSTLSISKYAILMKECPKQEHAAAFLWCMGRLFSSPSPAMAVEVGRLRARIGRRNFSALHIRTFGADMHIPAEATTPDPNSTLRFLAWEITLKLADGTFRTLEATEYAAALRAICANASEPLYVAADSRSAVLMAHQLCPGNVISLPHEYGQVRAHGERRVAGRGVNSSAALSSSMCVWSTVSNSSTIPRFYRPTIDPPASRASPGLLLSPHRSTPPARRNLQARVRTPTCAHINHRSPDASYACATAESR